MTRGTSINLIATNFNPGKCKGIGTGQAMPLPAKEPPQGAPTIQATGVQHQQHQRAPDQELRRPICLLDHPS